MSIGTIKPEELFRMRSEGKVIDLIDVRTAVEFRAVHAEGARNVPLDRLEPSEVARSRSASADEPIYVICQSGARGQQGCARFAAAGIENVVNVEGGTREWERAGLPVVKGKKAISLERQIRIAAGGLVFLGAALALLVHPYFAGLSAFVGAGLVFSGVTDTCGMGLLLGKMPWNRAKDSGGNHSARPTTSA